MSERIYKVGDRVAFYGRPSTVVYVNSPMRHWHRWSYHVRMDGDRLYTTDLQRTAIGVRGEELAPLEECVICPDCRRHVPRNHHNCAQARKEST